MLNSIYLYIFYVRLIKLFILTHVNQYCMAIVKGGGGCILAFSFEQKKTSNHIYVYV